MASDYTTSAALKTTLSLSATTYADADIAAAITAASRAIDKLCNRRFWLDTDANQVRYYTPYSLSTLQVDDITTFTSLATDPSGDNTFPDTWTLHTDFELEPLNAAADGEPYTKLVVRANGSFVFPFGYTRSVKVTAQFGWPAIPQGIVDATTIVATQLLKRKREAPFGVLAIGADGAAIRLAKMDPQVAMLVGPYQRHRIGVA